MPTAAYTTRDGTRVPGTTTIIGRFKDSGALMHWAFEQGRSGAASLYEKRDDAADVGTKAHEIIEMHLTGHIPEEVDIVSEGAQQVWNVFQQYRTWERQSGIKILTRYQEISLVSEEHRFGGTPDALGTIDGELVLLDWKTSNGVYPDYTLQLAAYKHLVEHGERLDTREPLGLGPVRGFHLLRFSKDHPDFEHRSFGSLDLEWEQFLALRQCYERDKMIKRRVR